MKLTFTTDKFCSLAVIAVADSLAASHDACHWHNQGPTVADFWQARSFVDSTSGINEKPSSARLASPCCCCWRRPRHCCLRCGTRLIVIVVSKIHRLLLFLWIPSTLASPALFPACDDAKKVGAHGYNDVFNLLGDSWSKSSYLII